MSLLGIVAVDGRLPEGMGHFNLETVASVLFDVGFDVADHGLGYAVFHKHGVGFGGIIQMKYASTLRALKDSNVVSSC